MSRFYALEDVTGQEYYQLPKDLIKNPKYKTLSANAKIAYAILKDRHQVSLKNGWIDELGVYFLLSDNELSEILDTSVRSASRYKNDLQEYDLIHMERQGLNKRNKIYILKPESAVYYKKTVEPLVDKDRTKLSSPDRTKLSNPDTTKLSSQDTTKLSTYSKNNLSKNNLSKLEEEEEASPLFTLVSFFSKNITSAGKQVVETKLSEWLTILPFDILSAELQNCALHGAKSWNYVEKAFKENQKLNITTIEELQTKYTKHEESRQAKTKKVNNSKKKNVREEVLPSWFAQQNEVSDLDMNNNEVVINEDLQKRKLELEKKMSLLHSK